jgi:hypothetical protein
VRTDGTVVCWGILQGHQTTPLAGTFSSVSTCDQNQYICGVRTDGTIACSGDNGFGAGKPPAGTFVSVSTGGCACGVKTDGTIACWGAGVNPWGQATPPAI